jgi:hypothetical protein
MRTWFAVLAVTLFLTFVFSAIALSVRLDQLPHTPTSQTTLFGLFVVLLFSALGAGWASVRALCD